jgi:hypothetical protein
MEHGRGNPWRMSLHIHFLIVFQICIIILYGIFARYSIILYGIFARYSIILYGIFARYSIVPLLLFSAVK